MANRRSLNHIYRTVWNRALGAAVAVPEVAVAGGHAGAAAAGCGAALAGPVNLGPGLGALAFGVALALWGVTSPDAWANPTGASAIVGSASLATQGNKLTVTTQNGTGLNHSAINWQSFSIPAGNTTHFQQPSAASTAINRVLTNTPSQLFGTLSSNGHLVLVNQAGITVGAGAFVDTAGFTASALRMSDADALAGRLRFGDATVSTAGISVQGRILARSGDAVLIAPNIDTGKDALIQAPNGSTLLAAGQQLEITGRGLEGISFQLQAPSDQALNLGTLSGNAVGIFAGTLRHSGQIRADAVVVEGGRVRLQAAGDAWVQGTGSIVARTKNAAGQEAGGRIDVLGQRVGLTGQALLDASGAAGGGLVRVGGDYQGKNPDVPNAVATYVGPEVQIRADAQQQGDGGRVIVWADDAARVHGAISARGGAEGGNGGFIETSGKNYLAVTQAADASAPMGQAGTWLLDPKNITVTADEDRYTSSGPHFESISDSAQISASTLNAALNSNTNVSLTTSSGGSGDGDIHFNAAVTKSSGSQATLTLNAQNNIHLNANISSTSDKLNLVMNADSDGSGVGDTVLGTATLNLNGGTFTATSNGGRVRLPDGSSFTLNNASATMTALSLAGGTYGGSGSTTVTGAFNVTGANAILSGTGSLTTQGTSTVNLASVSGGYLKLDGGWTLTNQGSFTIAGNDLVWPYYGTLTNASGGILNFSTTSQYPIDSSGGGSVTNAGTLNQTAAGPHMISAGSFSNTGTVNVQAGSLKVNTTGTDTGTYFVSAGTALEFVKNRTLSAGSSITGGGAWKVWGGATVTLNGTLGLSGAGSSVEVEGILNVNSNQTWDSGTTVTLKNELGGVGTITLQGPLNVTGGYGRPKLTGAGTLITQGTTLISIPLYSDPLTLASGKTWLNQGTLSLADNDYISLNGTLTNAAGATFNVSSTASTPLWGSGTLNNQGTLNYLGTGSQTIQPAFTNSGVFNLASGTAVFSGNLTQTGVMEISAGATLRKTGGFTNTNTGTLSGSGTIDVGADYTLTNNGTLRPGGSATVGTLNITGNLAMGSTGILDLDVSGATTAGTDYDLLGISGAFTRAGELQLTERGGFKTRFSDSLTPITHASSSGAFNSVSTIVSAGTAAFGVTNASTSTSVALVSGTTAYTSTGSTGWSVSANWDRGTPTAAADAVIGVGGNNTVAVTTSAAAKTLTVSGSNTLAVGYGGYLSVAGSANITNLSITDGALSVTGGLTVSNSLAQSGGDVTAASMTATQVSGNISLSGGSLVTTGALSLTALAGGINQTSGRIEAGGAATVSAAGGADVKLDQAGNNFSSLAVAAAGSAVTLSDTNALVLGSVTAGTLTVNAGGSITQSGASTVSGASSFTATGSGAIVLTNADNDFSTVSLTASSGYGGAISVVDKNALTVSSLSAGANRAVTLQSGAAGFGGALTLPASSIATGSADLTLISGGTLSTAGALSGANLTLTGATGLTLAHNVTASGSLSLSAAAGNISQTGGVISADGPATVVAGGESVNLGGTNFLSTLAINAPASSVDLSVGRALALGNTSAANLAVTMIGGDLTQTQGTAVTVTGDTTLTVISGDITLTNAGNNFNTVQATANGSEPHTISLRDVNDLKLGAVKANGNISVVTSGNLTVLGEVTSRSFVSFFDSNGYGGQPSVGGQISLTATTGNLTVEGSVLSQGSDDPGWGEARYGRPGGNINLTAGRDIVVAAETGRVESRGGGGLNGAYDFSAYTVMPGTNGGNGGSISIEAGRDVTVAGIVSSLGGAGGDGGAGGTGLGSSAPGRAGIGGTSGESGGNGGYGGDVLVTASGGSIALSGSAVLQSRGGSGGRGGDGGDGGQGAPGADGVNSDNAVPGGGGSGGYGGNGGGGGAGGDGGAITLISGGAGGITLSAGATVYSLGGRGGGGGYGGYGGDGGYGGSAAAGGAGGAGGQGGYGGAGGSGGVVSMTAGTLGIDMDTAAWIESLGGDGGSGGRGGSGGWGGWGGSASYGGYGGYGGIPGNGGDGGRGGNGGDAGDGGYADNIELTSTGVVSLGTVRSLGGYSGAAGYGGYGGFAGGGGMADSLTYGAPGTAGQQGASGSQDYSDWAGIVSVDSESTVSLGTVVADRLSVTANGSVAQKDAASLSITTLAVDSRGGDINLDRTDNWFYYGSINATSEAGDGGAVSLRTGGNFVLDDLKHGPNKSVSLVAGLSLSLPQSAIDTGSADLTLRSDYFGFSTSGALSGRNVSIIGTNPSGYEGRPGLTLAHSVTASGSLTLSAGAGGINQTGGAITAGGVTTVTADDSGAVTLNQAANNLSSVVVTAANSAVLLNNANALVLGSTSAASLTVTAGGNITQSGSVTVTGNSSLTANAGGGITLANPGNDFNTVTLTASSGYGGAISVVDKNALTVSSMSAGANKAVTLQSGAAGYGGTLTLPSGAINTGSADLTLSSGGTLSTPGALSGANLTLTGATGLTLAHNVTATGSLSLSAATSGGINQANGAIIATGATSVTAGYAGAVNLNQAANDFSALAISAPGSAVTLRDANDLMLGSTAAGTLTLTAGGNLTQSGALTVTGEMAVSAAGSVTLTHANNNFSSLTLSSGGSASLRDSNALVLGNVSAPGLEVTAGGNVTQLASTAIVVPGATQITVSGGDVALNNLGNDFGSLSAAVSKTAGYGGAISVADSNSLTLSGIVAGGNITATAQNDLVLSGLVSAPRGESGGTVRLTATLGAITKTQPASDLDVQGRSIHLTAATGIGTGALPIKVWEDSGSDPASLHFTNTNSSGVFISSDQDLHVDEGSNAGGSITLASNADLVINGALTGNGAIQLSTLGEMVVNADDASTLSKVSVSAARFTLNSGTWRQVASALPAFEVGDFRIDGGTFIRALGGDGTAGTPYRLTDVYGLQGVGSAGILDKSFVLANHIDAATTTSWGSGAGFAPIGSDVPFSGSFDGNGYTIRQLKVAGYDNAGLFGTVGSAGRIANLGLVDPQVSGNNNVGAIAGRNGGLISGSFALKTLTGVASVFATGYGVGGLVGRSDAPISESQNQTGRIENSYAALPVTGAGDVGGLVGYNADAAVVKSYAAGAVARTISEGRVSEGRVGGLVGYGGSVSASYWDTAASSQAESSGGTGLGATEMNQLSNYVGWNISGSGGSESVWRLYEGQTAPLLRKFLTPLDVIAGNGTRVYDGTTSFNGSVTFSATPEAGLVLGSASYTLSSKDAGQRLLTPSGLYSQQLGYDLRFIAGAVEVTARPLTLSASKVYDGTSDLTGKVTLGNLVGTETLGYTGALASDAHVATANKSISAINLSNGTGYGGGVASNYQLPVLGSASSANAVTITPAPLSASAAIGGSLSKVYDGGTGTTANVTGTVSGAVAGDSLSLNTSAVILAYNSKDVATASQIGVSSGNATLVIGNSSVGSVASDYSYSAPVIAPVAAGITARPLTLSASKVYDGTSDLMGKVTLGNLVEGESLGYTGAWASDAHVATANKSISAINLSNGTGYGGGVASNYQLPVLGSASSANAVTITPAPLSASAAIGGSLSKVYDGGTGTTANVTGTVSGAVAGDSLSLNTSAVILAYNSKDVATASQIGVSSGNATLVIGNSSVGSVASDYSYSAPVIAPVAAGISQKALTISGITAADKVYDGTTVAAVSTAGVNADVLQAGGLVPGDQLTVTATGLFDNKNVGSGKTVSLSSSYGGDDVGNYLITGQTSTTATVSVRPTAVWTGGASGSWSNPANWDALPDGSNVLTASIPAGVSVVFDSTVGPTRLQNITSAGALSITSGSLAVAGSLTSPVYAQSGGVVSGGGALTVGSGFSQGGGSISLGGAVDITQAVGDLTVGAINAASIKLSAASGSIRQTAALTTAGLLSTQSAGATTLTDTGNRIAAFTANSGGSIGLSNGVPIELQGLLASVGNINVDNIGGISTTGAVAAPSGAVSLTANSPLTIGAAGVQALSDINLNATNLTSAGNLTLGGDVVSTGGSVDLSAAANLVQNSAVRAAQSVRARAGTGGTGSLTFGVGASTDAKSISYLLNSLAAAAPPRLDNPVPASVAPTNFVTAFLSVFEQALTEPAAATSESAKPAASEASKTADSKAADSKADQPSQAAKEKEKDKDKEKEKAEVVIGGNVCTPS